MNKEQLIPLLVDRTGMGRAEVDDQLKELTEQLHQIGKDQEKFLIKDFGTFTAVQDRLEFQPSEALETEINNRYAGMRPIELIGAYKESGSGEEDLKSEEIDQVHTQLRAGEQPKQKENEASEEKNFVEEGTEEIDKKEIAAAPEGAEKQEKERTTAVENIEEQEQKSATKTKRPQPTRSKRSNPIAKVMVAILVILLLVLGLLAVFDAGLFDNGEKKVQPSQQNTPAEQQGSKSRPSGEKLPQENELRASAVASNEKGGASVNKKVYGIHGKWAEDVEKDYYTIVVHSFRTQTKAEEVIEGLKEQNYRATFKRSAVNGDSYFRVSIGQFETREEAQEHIPDLPEQLRKENFIHLF